MNLMIFLIIMLGITVINDINQKPKTPPKRSSDESYTQHPVPIQTRHPTETNEER